MKSSRIVCWLLLFQPAAFILVSFPPSFGCFDHLFQVLSYCKLVNSTTTDNRFELKEKVNKLNLKTLDDNFVRDCFFFSYLIQCSIKN